MLNSGLGLIISKIEKSQVQKEHSTTSQHNKHPEMKANLFTRNTIGFLAVIALVMVISSCSNSENITACLEGRTYGFWYGLLHGIIAPVDLVMMLFRDDITVYAQNNNGAWYGLGFIIGSGGWGFLGGKSSSRRKD